MDEVPGPTIEIEIVYALPQKQYVQSLRVPVGATIAQALERSGIRHRHPEIIPGSAAVGIFGKRADLSAVLHDRDRIEIYRPLIADPKQARRARAIRRVKPAR